MSHPSQIPLYPTRKPITPSQISLALSRVLSIQEDASSYHGKRPFAAALLGPDNEKILLTHFSLSHIRHAETQLARLASDHYSQPYLWQCTLISTWEPCVMCAGSMYWANIGRLVYAASEEKLIDLTGKGNKENIGFQMECREVFKAGQKDIEIIGPVEGWEEMVVESARGWWEKHGGAGSLHEITD